MSYITSRKHAVAARRAPSTSAAFAVAALALPGAALAQNAAPAPAAAASQAAATLPTVKVQAQAEGDYKADMASSAKFTQALVDTPQTITVIKRELFQQQAATTLADVLRNTPGVTMQLGENGSTQTGDSISLRGFDTSASIFVDGVRDLGAISRDVFNIDAVEVVKGPSGSDNGRGASSGYINLVTKTPQKDRFAEATLTVGSASRKRIAADLNTPLDIGLDGAALRLNVVDQDYGVPGRDQVKAKRWGVAPSLALGLGTPTRVTFAYLHVQQANKPDGGVSAFGLPGYVYTATQQAGPKVDPHNYYGLDGDFDDVQLDMFTSRIEHDLAPGSTLRNTTRLGRTSEQVVVTGVNAVAAPLSAASPSAYTATRSRQGRDQDNQILTNQTNLSTEFRAAGLKHSLSTGAEFTYEYQRTATPVSVSYAATSLYSPNANDPVATPQYMGTYTRGTTLTAAAYAFDTLAIGDRWLVNGGVRWDKFHTETTSATYTAATAATSTAAAVPASFTQNAPAALTDSVWSWKVGVVFKPAANGSVYLETSDSKQPPGGSNFALSTATANGQASNQANAATKPQEGRNLEAGTKWDFLDGRLGITGAVYSAENRNELISDGLTPATYSQVGKRRVQGIELSVVGQLTDKLNLSAGFSTQNSKILKGTTTTSTTGVVSTQQGAIVFTPKINFTSWATYKLPFGLTAGGGVRYVDTAVRSSSSSAASASGLLTAPSYWVVDGMLGYEINRNVSLQLNGYNLFDKFYLATLNNGGSRYTPGAERNALLSATVKF